MNLTTKEKASIVIASIVIIGLAIGIIHYSGVGDKISPQKKIKSILFIGDSNTDNHFSYADQLKKMYPDLKIKKIAKFGEKTDWMLTQLKDELKNNKYDAISILGGSNDIYALNKILSAENNLDSMYQLAKKSGAKVIAVTPPNKDFYVNKTEEKQVLLKDLINYIEADKNKDYFINFWDISKDKKYFTPADGYLHPQASAHKILANEFAKALKLS